MGKQYGNSDSGDYTYPGQVRLVPAEPNRQFEVTPFPARAQAEVDDLRKRVAHLEACVHRLMNQDGEL